MIKAKAPVPERREPTGRHLGLQQGSRRRRRRCRASGAAKTGGTGDGHVRTGPSGCTADAGARAAGGR